MLIIGVRHVAFIIPHNLLLAGYSVLPSNAESIAVEKRCRWRLLSRYFSPAHYGCQFLMESHTSEFVRQSCGPVISHVNSGFHNWSGGETFACYHISFLFCFLPNSNRICLGQRFAFTIKAISTLDTWAIRSAKPTA